jgi:hypothetical protein
LLNICDGDAAKAKRMSVSFKTLLHSDIGSGKTRFNVTSVEKHINTVESLIASLP